MPVLWVLASDEPEAPNEVGGHKDGLAAYAYDVAKRESDCVGCPAGEALGQIIGEGAGVRCRILHETLTERNNPSTVENYCTGDYKQCSVWRAQWRAREEGREREIDRDILANTPKDERPGRVAIG